jgi:hypothetical protein
MSRSLRRVFSFRDRFVHSHNGTTDLHDGPGRQPARASSRGSNPITVTATSVTPTSTVSLSAGKRTLFNRLTRSN